MLRSPVHIALLTLAMTLQAVSFAQRADAVPSGAAEVNARLVKLGSPFQVTVTITSEESIQVEQPTFPSPDGLRLTNSHLGPGETAYSFVAEYVAEEPGKYELGPFRVVYRSAEGEPGEIIVPAVSVEVYEDAPRPVSDIILGRMSWWKYAVTILLLAILAGLIALFIRVRKQAPDAAPALTMGIGRSPEQLAVEEIRALPIPDAGDAAAVKEYYGKVDGALRTYLKRRYEVPTHEVTSWEIQREFHTRKRLDARVKGVFVLINDCDWVKFAKTRPAAREIQAVPDRAADILTGRIIPEVKEPERIA